MNAEVVKAEFGHTQALGMKRSNGKRCPAEAVWLEERTLSFGNKFFVCLATPRGMWDLRSPMRDRACCSGGTES